MELNGDHERAVGQAPLKNASELVVVDGHGAGPA